MRKLKLSTPSNEIQSTTKETHKRTITSINTAQPTSNTTLMEGCGALQLFTSTSLSVNSSLSIWSSSSLSTPSSISSKPSNSQVWRKHRQEQASDLHVEPGDPDEGSSWRVALQWHWYLLMQGVLNEQNRANLKQVLIFNNWTQNAPGQIPSGWGAIPWSRCQTSPSSHSSGKIFPYPDYCF